MGGHTFEYEFDFVVTFYRAPDPQPPELSDLFESTVTWEKYRIDAYAVVLGPALTANTVETILRGHRPLH